MTVEEILRRLALQDEEVVRDATVATLGSRACDSCGRPGGVLPVARLGALVALGAEVVSYQAAVVDSLAAGLAEEEIVGALLTVAPLVGIPRITAAAPSIAAALGYDLDTALECLDGLPNDPK